MKQTTTAPKTGSVTNGSFQQKSAGVSLIVIVATGMYYFMKVIELLQAGAPFEAGSNLPDGYWQLAVGTLVLIIVVEATTQTVLAIGAGRIPALTERDIEAALKAKRNAYAVLAVGVFMTVGCLFLIPSPFVIGNVLLLFFISAEVVRYVSQILNYHHSA